MRAFLSLVLTLLFLSSALALLKMGQSMAESARTARTQILQQEAIYGYEVEAKRAIIDTISITNTYSEALLFVGKERITIDDKKMLIGGVLAALEGTIESEFASVHGISIDLWCGSITDLERKELAEKMVARRGVLKCTNCYDWAYPALYKGRPTSICAAALIIDSITGDVKIAEDPDQLFVPTLKGRDLAIGVSIYDGARGVASVGIVPTGTVIR